MVSNNKRMIKDIFGDDEDDIEQSQNGGRDNKGTGYEPTDSNVMLEKKAKPVEGGEVTGHDPEITVEQKLLHLERDFELAVKSVQSTRTKRKKNEGDIETKLDRSAACFVAKMQDTALQDIHAKMNGQIAVAKVKMLEDVKNQLNKTNDNRSHLHSTFLDAGILESMKIWMELLLDASLPSLDIVQLPIQTDQLKSSGIGRVVYYYSKVDESRVTRDINRKAHSLVSKWSGPILNRSQDFNTKNIIYAEADVPPAPKRRRNSNNIVAAASSEQWECGSFRSTIVVTTLPPESSITCDKSHRGKSDKYKKLKSHMAKIKRS
ncbi:MAG: hypothetical protein J3R72DRAFT_527164 [Linnemannia gamsii]|nr:MAG: hypothetical protein J3R72DRAFT_527164 [Linnemannia gamsii]